MIISHVCYIGKGKQCLGFVVEVVALLTSIGQVAVSQNVKQIIFPN